MMLFFPKMTDGFKYPILRKLAVIMLIFKSLSAFAQNNAALPLDWISYRNQVLTQHPAARQADLRLSQARAYLMKARGGFDVKAYADMNGKNFGGKDYFVYSEAGLKWPSWMGLEFKSAFYQTGGAYLNPESGLPENGQLAAGFTWNLGQGLLFDARRADLAQARIGLRAAEAERRVLLNDLLLASAKAYWTWVVADNQLRVYEAALAQARLRHDALKESVVQGDKPAIDTVETLLQVQSRQFDVNFARVERQNAALEVANFWWTDENTTLPPEQLPPAPAIDQMATPARPAPELVSDLRRQALSSHPEVLLYDAKLQSLAVDRRLAREGQKPDIVLNYNILGKGLDFFPAPYPGEGLAVLTNNVKYGISVGYPLLNRKARGTYQAASLKWRDTELALDQKRQTVALKFGQYANELDNYAGQLLVFNELTTNYRLLLDAEQEKFRFGESSIFLINTREQRWLDARIKYQKLLGEFYKTEAALQWSAGVLSE